MEYAELRADLETVAFTTITPFSEDGGDVLFDRVAANTDYLLDGGASVLVPCGNTGEYYSLSDAERVGVVEATVEAAGDDARVVAGVGGSTKRAAGLIRQYEAAGADAVMLMHPHHTYVHQEGLIRYYETLAASTEMGVVLYCRSADVSNRVLAALAERENVVAIKYAVNDVSGFADAIAATSGDVVWLNGIAERFAMSYTVEGAAGFTTGIGGFAPGPVLALFEAVRDGDWERARELRDPLRRFENLRSEAGTQNHVSSAYSVPAVKHGMELAGQYGGPVREPIVDLDEVAAERATALYEEIAALDT